MKRKYIRWTIVFAWAAVIFLFSCQNGDSSGNNNRLVIEIAKMAGVDLNALCFGYADLIIRKLAHMTEFFILCMLLFRALPEEVKLSRKLIICICTVFLYACSDEFHQIFVQGRGPSFKDVLIDTAGGSVYVLINAFMIKKDRNKRK